MVCSSLKLVQFKNYQEVYFDFHDRINIIFGLNGMGKTNVLDALHYLCMVKSNFSNRDQFSVQHEKGFFRLEGAFCKSNNQYDIALKFADHQGKEMCLNSKVYEKLSDHIGLVPVVFSAPKDIYLLTGASTERRNLLDRVLSQLDHEYLSNLSLYKNLLKHRNALLKAWLVKKVPKDLDLLVSYSERMTCPATYISKARNDFIGELNAGIKKRYEQISKERELVSCRYKSELINQNLAILMDKNHSYDIASGRTNSGVHKDDIEFYIDGFPAKDMASQGQLKSLMLSLKFALYDILYEEKQDKPILLLDDIFAKLDRERIRELIKLILEQDMGQVFITDTDIKRMDEIMAEINLPYRKFEIEYGKIRSVENMET